MEETSCSQNSVVCTRFQRTSLVFSPPVAACAVKALLQSTFGLFFLKRDEGVIYFSHPGGAVGRLLCVFFPSPLFSLPYYHFHLDFSTMTFLQVVILLLACVCIAGKQKYKKKTKDLIHYS